MKLLKLITLAGLVTLCYGQMSGDDNMTDSPTPTPTPTPTPAVIEPTISTPTPAVIEPTTSTPTPTPAVIEPTPAVIVVTASRTYRDDAYYRRIYNGTGGIYDRTSRDRYARYNCHNRSREGVIMNRVPSNFVFTVFLQMPVLHFLDLRYKIELMERIRQRLDINSTITRTRSTDLDTFNTPPEICIDGYDQAFVGSFDEGIMLRIYQRPINSAIPELNGTQLRDVFDRNPRRIETSFEGLPSLDYLATDGRTAVIGRRWTGRVSINLGGCRQLDYDYNRFNGARLNDRIDGGLRCTSLNTEEQEDVREELAENPDPINFYLEAGDYVFAVLGSIAVAIVLGLATLGYCIHPFFLA